MISWSCLTAAAVANDRAVLFLGQHGLELQEEVVHYRSTSDESCRNGELPVSMEVREDDELGFDILNDGTFCAELEEW